MDRLHRRDFLVATGAAAATAASAGTAARASETTGAAVAAKTTVAAPAIVSDTRELRLAMPWPDTIAGFGDSAVRLARRVELASSGRFSIIALAGDAGRKAIVSRDADLVHGFEGDEVARHPAFGYFGGLPGYSSLNAVDLDAWLAVGGGQDLWDDLAAEFGRKPLLAGHTGPCPGLWSSISLRGLADLSGQGVATIGLGRQVVAGLGAKPVSVAASDYGEALSSGAAVAAECGGAQANMALGLAAPAKHIYGLGLAPAGSVLSLSLKRSLWDGLTHADRLLFAGCAFEELRLTLAETRAHESVTRLALGVQHDIRTDLLPDDILHAIGAVSDAVVAETAAGDARAARINASYMMFRDALNPANSHGRGARGGVV